MSAPTPPSDLQRAAYQAGRDAWAAGSESITCPYPGDQPDPEGLRTLWIRGYVNARRDAGVLPPAPPRQAPPGLVPAPTQAGG